MKMEEFKKDLLSLCKRSILGPVLFLLIAVGCILLASTGTDYDPFDGTSSGYAKLDVVYVMGPFAEQTNEDGNTTNEYYIAEDADGYWLVIGTNMYNMLPVYGEDIGEDDIADLTPETVYGYSTEIPDELAYYLVDYFDGTGADLTTDNYTDYFGSYYLDTTDKDAGSIDLFLYIFGGVMALLAVIIFFAGGTKRRAVKKQLKAMEESGELQTIFDDFASGQKFFYNKAKIAMSQHYIIDVSVQGAGFRVVPLENVVNVFKCNMVDGEPTSTNYIALETADGKRYLVAACAKTGREFDNVLMQLKSMTNGGRQW